MGLLIDIEKISENEQEVIYSFRTVPIGNSGKIAISKRNGECFVLEEPEWDTNHKLAARVGIKLEQHWKKGEFPDVTCWAS